MTGLGYAPPYAHMSLQNLMFYDNGAILYDYTLLENDFVADLIGSNTAQCNSLILCWFSFNTRHNLHGQTMTQTPQPRSHSTVIVKTIFSHKKNKRSCNRWRGSHRALISTSRTQSGKTRGDKTRNTVYSSTRTLSIQTCTTSHFKISVRVWLAAILIVDIYMSCTFT